MACEHREFAAEVNVARLEDSGTFRAEVKVQCAECRAPFRFLGLPWGLLNEAPTTDVTGLELNAPIVPWSADRIPERGIQRGVYEMPSLTAAPPEGREGA